MKLDMKGVAKPLLICRHTPDRAASTRKVRTGAFRKKVNISLKCSPSPVLCCGMGRTHGSDNV